MSLALNNWAQSCNIKASPEALAGVLGNREIMSFISGEQENTSLKRKQENKGNFGVQAT